MTSLDTCGFEKLITICHGDAKPNNFLFRNINIEFDDLDLGEDLDCEGLQSIYDTLSFYVTKTVLVGSKWFWSDQIDLDLTIMIWSRPK